MLIGQDLSHWNGDNVDVNAGDFVVIKVSQGTTWEDSKAKDYVQRLNSDQLVGCYHYLTASDDINKAWLESDHFVKTVIGLGLMYKSLLVVDYENESLGHQDYLLKFLEGVKIMTGLDCVVYCSSSETKKLKKTAKSGYPLWVAHYKCDKPKVNSWNSWLMWQFTYTPWDMDLFNGSKEDWLKLTVKQND